MQYLFQSMNFRGDASSKPYKDLLQGVGTEEISHVELIGTTIGEAIYVIQNLHEGLRVSGDVCEFGVAQGATSRLLASEIMSTDRKLWLFDSFEGLPAPGPAARVSPPPRH